MNVAVKKMLENRSGASAILAERSSAGREWVGD